MKCVYCHVYQVTNVAETHIQPTLVETYTKHTETDITLEHEIFVRTAVRLCVFYVKRWPPYWTC